MRKQQQVRTAAFAMVAMATCGVVNAQSASQLSVTYQPPASVRSASVAPMAFQSRENWNTIMTVSAIVLVIGLIQSDSTLMLLGGAGVLVSMVQRDKRFTMQYSPRGLDLVKTGPVTMGLTPFSQGGRLVDGPGRPRMGTYVTASWRF